MEDVLIGLEIGCSVCSFWIKDESGLSGMRLRSDCIILSFIIIIDGVIGDDAFDAVFGVGSFGMSDALWRIHLLILLRSILQ